MSEYDFGPDAGFVSSGFAIGRSSGVGCGNRAPQPVIPVFIWSPTDDELACGAAGRWWLHQSLTTLAGDLEKHGSRLIPPRPAVETISQLARETSAGAVYWGRCYEPAAREVGREMKETLSSAGIEARSLNTALLSSLGKFANRFKTPFQVFTPYWRACLARGEPGHASGPPQVAAPGSLAEIRNTRKIRPRTQDRLGRRAARTLEARRARSSRAGSQASDHRAGRLRNQAAIGGVLTECRSFHRICTLARSAHDKSGMPFKKSRTSRSPQLRQHPKRTCVNWYGESSPTICCSMRRIPASSRCVTSLPGSAGVKIPMRYEPGSGQTGYPIVDAGMRVLGHRLDA